MATGRREFTWQACDALAAAGRKPSISSVREWTLTNHGKKQGSDTDTQADINAWYGVLLAMKQEKQTITGLPDDIASLARGLWIKACEAANEGLAVHRAAIDAALQDAQREVREAQSEATAAGLNATAIGHDLDVARESIRRLEDALSALRATIQATEVRHGGQIEARDGRITMLSRDLALKETEHAARIVEFDGLRRHALTQIEEARADSRHWKNEYERTVLAQQAALAAERQATGHARSELAGVSGRLSAIEESLAAALQRNEVLEMTIAQAQNELGGPSRTQPGKRAAGSIHSRSLMFKRRKT